MADLEAVAVDVHDVRAHFLELGGDTFHVLWNDALDEDIAVGGRRGHHVGPGCNLVGHHRIGAGVELLHAVDAEGVRAGALDVGAHFIEEVRHVDDVRFLRGIFDDCAAFGENRRQHHVDRRAHRHDVHVNIRRVEMIGVHFDAAVFDDHVGAEGFKAFDVLVNRAVADVAAAGQRDNRVAVAAQQRAEQIVGRAHFADFVLIRGTVVGQLISGIDGEHVVLPVDLRADSA